jgi:hypothetical protein
MGSGGMMYIPGFMKIDSGIQKLLEGISIQTCRQQGNFISLLLFIKIRKEG